MSAADRLTVLTSVNRKLASKTFSRGKDGTIKNRSYGNEKYFSIASVAVTGIVELGQALEEIAGNPYAFVVRGEPVPGINRKRARRLLHPDSKTGEPATFAETRRHWFLVDADEVPCPAATDPRFDPEEAVDHVIGLLPPECWDAWCWWQFSSSQSVYPDKQTLRVHLWFWLEAPLGSDELKRWAIAVNTAAGYKLVDPSLFSAAQAHYLAPPEFVAPLVDPLPQRCGLLTGLDQAVSLVIPPPHPKRADEPSTTGYTPGQGTAAYLAMIGGARGFREPIKKAIASYIAIWGGKADCTELKKEITKAIDRADPGGRSDNDLERYKSDKHLDEIIAAIRAFQGDTPGRGVKTEPPPPPPEFDAAPPHPGEDAEPPDPEEDEDSGPLPAEFSEEALALQFSALHANDWRYVALWGKWQQWLATYWRNEETLRVFELARRICRRNSPQAAMISEKLGRDVCRAGTVAAVERLARADRRHAMRFDQYDAPEWDFNQPPRKE